MLYLKGRYFWNKRTEEDIQKALDYFQQAVDLDPGYSRAWVGIADAWIFRGWYSLLAPRRPVPEGQGRDTEGAGVRQHAGGGARLAGAHPSRVRPRLGRRRARVPSRDRARSPVPDRAPLVRRIPLRDGSPRGGAATGGDGPGPRSALAHHPDLGRAALLLRAKVRRRDRRIRQGAGAGPRFRARALAPRVGVRGRPDARGGGRGGGAGGGARREQPGCIRHRSVAPMPGRGRRRRRGQRSRDWRRPQGNGMSRPTTSRSSMSRSEISRRGWIGWSGRTTSNPPGSVT